MKRESIIQTMVNKFLTWLSKKTVTALYKRTHFWVFSWGLDENTDLNLMSEESYHDRHRFGLHEETYERKTENSSEKPNNSTTEDCSDIEEWYTFRDEQEYNARHGKE